MSITRRSATSDKDYFEIWRHIAVQGRPNAADTLLRSFDAAIAFLADHLRAGPARPELRKQLRSYPVGKYLILYRPIRNGVEVSRVVHGSRDLHKLFPKR